MNDYEVEKYVSLNGEYEDDKHLNLETESKQRLYEFRDKLRNGENFIMVKFGDGEWRNMIYNDDTLHNCDLCYYYKGLGIDLIQSYIYFLKTKNAYINRWYSHVYDIQDSLENDNKEFYNSDKFLYYALIVHTMTEDNSFKQEQVDFFTELKRSKKNKIYISHIDMIHAVAKIMNINQGISIPLKNSYLEKHKILEFSRNLLSEKPEDNIILVSAGMFAKVLIAILSKEFPKNTFIDIGSTFDGLIRASRDFNGTVEYQQLLLKYYS